MTTLEEEEVAKRLAEKSHEEETKLAELKIRKSRAQAAFTRTRNRFHNYLSDEDTPKGVLAGVLDTLESNMDALIDVLTEIVQHHQVNGKTAEMRKSLNDIDEINAKYEESAHLYRSFGTESDSSSVQVEESAKNVSSDMYKQLKRVSIPIFKGEKKQYEFWKSAFTTCIDNTNSTPEYKFLQLRQYLGGEALKAVDGLGHSAVAYEAAKERLERKFGGQRRKVNRFLEEIDAFPVIKYENTTMINKFADLLDIAIINLKESETGDVNSQYLCLQLVKKLPQSMITRYERWKFEHEKEESVETLKEWVIKEAEFFEVATETKGGLAEKRNEREKFYAKSERNFHATEKYESKLKCKLCSGNHGLWNCMSFKSLPVSERWNKAKELKLCFRCLSENHIGSKCPKNWVCREKGCRRNHHTLLHTSESRPSFGTSKPTAASASQPSENHSHSAYQNTPRVALRTVPVIIYSGNRKLKVNALLDDGSTRSYLNADVAAELGLNTETSKITVNVLNGKSETFESTPVTVSIESLNGQIKKNIEAQTIKSVTGNMQAVDWNRYSKQYPHLREISFPHIGQDQKVDLLIGVDYAEFHMSLHEIRGEPGQPIARLTPLGWTCVGPTSDQQDGNPNGQEYESSMYTFFQRDGRCSEINELSRTMKEFWEVEHDVITNKPDLTQDEQQVLIQTEKSLKFQDGRYEVGIPWKDNVGKIPDNYMMAVKRLEHTEKRLKRQPELAKSYSETIDNYEKKGYVQKVDQSTCKDSGHWYLPHFPVIRPDKQTTKVRLVFDASAKFDEISLNDAIHQGPKLQRDLFDVLLRFRKYPVAIVCDIAEMYLQIGLAEQDRPFHQFLWRQDPESVPDVYQFNRLVFGVNCSPFLAQYVSQKHASVLVDEYPRASETLLESTYMDDSMDSVINEEKGVELYHQLSSIWAKAGMYARKWLSNSARVLEEIPLNDRASEVNLETGNMPSIKTLGVWWSSADDKFNIRVNELKEQPLTKRTVLSKIATVFDPIGIVAPVTIKGKILLQEIWTAGLDWDEPLNHDIEEKVKRWLHELSELDSIKMDRSLDFNEDCKTELHVFSDASTEAFGAVAYVRHISSDGNVVIRFVAAKTRVAPLKSISIPRLELLAAILGLKLSEHITKTLHIPISDVTYWSDSMNVLWWVRSKSRHFKPFVANRIGIIQSVTDTQQWRYVPGKENPADLTTRGRTVTDLSENTLWWNGPKFLEESEEAWPENRFQPNIVGKCEIKAKANSSEEHSFVTVNEERQSTESVCFRLVPENYSSWTHYTRILAWTIRFIENCRIPKHERVQSHELQLSEIQNAEICAIRSAQHEVFDEEHRSLISGTKLSNSSKLLPLNPVVDEDGVLRCSSRLRFVEHLSDDSKYPIILPRNHSVTKLIVKHFHEKGNHCGTNQTLSLISTRYWVLSAREVIREVENECAKCKRLKARTGHQIMGPLPNFRAGASMRAFSETAVDFAGPFLTKQGRGKPKNKRYLCLFTCMSCRAVHLEMAYSLDTDSFLNAFFRFVSRRGFPKLMLSDNGTNFVGAVRELKELASRLDQDKIARNAANRGVQWKFIPPGAPHFGGVHESMVKSAKRALFNIIGNADVTDEELTTSFIGAESLINSRPLTYQSANPADDCVLTPNHFLFGQCGGEFAPESVDTENYNIRKRWRRVQELMRHFWSRWLKEFLPTLSSRKKWHKQGRDFAVGDVVMVIDPDSTRGSWTLGRIQQVHPGADGHVRVATVRQGGKLVKRPTNRLCLLEAEVRSNDASAIQ